MQSFATNTKSNDQKELVFIPTPTIGHMVSTVELAKLLIDRDQLLSISILLMKTYDSAMDAYVQSAATSSPERICFINLPRDNSTSRLTGSGSFIPLFIETQKTYVKEAVIKIAQKTSHPCLAGFIVDLFCASMIDVANKLEILSFLFSASASFLGFLFHIQSLHDQHRVDVTKPDADAELEIPTLEKPLPVKLFLPCRMFRETLGILVNTFFELEPYAIKSLSLDIAIPTIYPIGPILDLKSSSKDESMIKITAWLDKQPASSVVYLCFSSMGSFGADQLKEMAHGLDLSSHRFLWSVRCSPPQKAGHAKAVLAHPAVGGFVSHCRWNSHWRVLWFEVPMASWPSSAEQ